jgi:hypothetical protein
MLKMVWWICLALLAAFSCGKREPAAGAGTSDSIVILLSARDSDDVGVFTLTPTGWTMENRSRASENTMELRKGAATAGALSYARTHVERGVAAINRSDPGDRYRVVVRVRAGAEVRELQASGETTAVFDAVLGGPIEVLWREASGIPKMYWYREVGPVDREHREEKPVE